MNVLEENEKAYNKRYGISLRAIWMELSDEQQHDYICGAKENDGKVIPEEYIFRTDEILRIAIGYINEEQLKGILKGATHVTRILLWEPDAYIFAAGCICRDVAQYINDERITIAIGQDEGILRYAMDMTIYENNINHRHIYTYGKYLDPNDKAVAIFLELFEEFYVNMVSKMKFGKQYGNLMFRNMLYAVSALNDNSTVGQMFDGIPVRNIPVIIVAAGPSLMRNCVELKRAKGKAVIVAVAHAMRTLAINDIKPDLVAAMDPNSPFFLDFDEKRDYTLLSCVSVNAEFQKAYNGRLIYYGFPIYKDMFSVRRVESDTIAELDTGSVATDVLSLFAAAGFKRFILVGQDLAYGEEGISHTEGEREVLEKDEMGLYGETEGIYGGIVKTRDDWILFRKYYEKRIMEDTSLDIIDSTEGGALIHGSRVMQLKEAIDKYCITDYPVENWISNTSKGDEEEKRFIDHWFEELDEMNMRTSTNLDRIISTGEELLSKWENKKLWDDDFNAKCKRYDMIYHIIMDGEDSIPIREYCRADLENYIEDALALEGDDNIYARMRREYDLFALMRQEMQEMQDYIKTIR